MSYWATNYWATGYWPTYYWPEAVETVVAVVYRYLKARLN